MAHWRQCTSAGQGCPSVPVVKDGEKGPCALPRIWGRSLSRSLLCCLLKDVAYVSHCVPGLGTREMCNTRCANYET